MTQLNISTSHHFKAKGAFLPITLIACHSPMIAQLFFVMVSYLLTHSLLIPRTGSKNVGGLGSRNLKKNLKSMTTWQTKRMRRRKRMPCFYRWGNLKTCDVSSYLPR